VILIIENSTSKEKKLLGNCSLDNIGKEFSLFY